MRLIFRSGDLDLDESYPPSRDCVVHFIVETIIATITISQSKTDGQHVLVTIEAKTSFSAFTIPICIEDQGTAERNEIHAFRDAFIVADQLRSTLRRRLQNAEELGFRHAAEGLRLYK